VVIESEDGGLVLGAANEIGELLLFQ